MELPPRVSDPDLLVPDIPKENFFQALSSEIFHTPDTITLLPRTLGLLGWQSGTLAHGALRTIPLRTTYNLNT